MKQRELQLRRNDDPTILEYDEKLLKKLVEQYNKLHLAATFMLEQYKSKALEAGFKDNTLGLLESYLVDFSKLWGYEGALEKERNQRYAEIRNLNEENRALRKQLGEKVSNDEFAEKSKNIGECIKKWWNITGLGFMNEESFSTYGGFSARLSGHASDGYYGKDENFENDQAKIVRFESMGFTFNEDKYLHDTDNNKRLLAEFLKEKYPSLRIREYQTVVHDTTLVIRDVKIFINDLTDIK